MIEGESAAHRPWHCERSHMDDPARLSPSNGEPRIRLVSGTPAATRPSTPTAASRTSSTTSSPSRASTRCSSGSPTRSTRSSRTRHCTSTRPTSRSASSCRRSCASEWAQEIYERRLPLRRRASPAGPSSTASPCSRTRLTSIRASRFVPGTPLEPEALIVVPLIARGALKGTLNVYRIGEDAFFTRGGVRAGEAPRRRGRARARQRAHPRAARARGADRLAHRPLQPPLLPRAPSPRADPGGERRTRTSRS